MLYNMLGDVIQQVRFLLRCQNGGGTSTPKGLTVNNLDVGALLVDLPSPDAADQAPGMTTAEAVEASYIQVQRLNATVLTQV